MPTAVCSTIPLALPGGFGPPPTKRTDRPRRRRWGHPAGFRDRPFPQRSGDRSAGTETHVYRPTRKAAATPANDESCMQTGCSRDKSSQKSSLSRPISPAATLRSRPNSRQSVRRAEGHGRSAQSPRAAHDSAGVQIGACCSTRAAAAA
jgi:hypothetical protein